MNTSAYTFSSSAHWQPALNATGVCEGVADIEQTIHIILTTPKGSIPHRPLFGLDLRYMDQDVDVAGQMLVRDSVDAVLYGEPRIKKVNAQYTANNEKGILKIQYYLVDGVLRETEVRLML